MSIHLQKELELLRKRVLAEGALVEDSIAKALRALLTRDRALAEQVLAGDVEIDQAEIEVEEACLKTLALNQPVADNLRFIVTVLKMNNDLERMGDHAVNIAKRAVYLARHDPIDWPGAAELEEMGENVMQMVKRCLDAMVQTDPELAKRICIDDDVIDQQKRDILGELRQELFDHPERANVLLKLIDVPRHLERIADLATNIAEDVIYMVNGAIVRHHHYDVE